MLFSIIKALEAVLKHGKDSSDVDYRVAHQQLGLATIGLL
jgi:hypothetical protein